MVKETTLECIRDQAYSAAMPGFDSTMGETRVQSVSVTITPIKCCVIMYIMPIYIMSGMQNQSLKLSGSQTNTCKAAKGTLRS